jgi:hypothetical protein
MVVNGERCPPACLEEIGCSGADAVERIVGREQVVLGLVIG